MKQRGFLLTGLVAAVVVSVALAACGGGGNKGGDTRLSEQQAEAVANSFFVTFFGTLSGSKSPQELIGLFTEKCRADVSVKSITAVVGLISLFAPDLAKAKIDGFDVGALNVEYTDTGAAKISPKDISKARIKLNGQWLRLDEFSKKLGFSQTDASFSSGSVDTPITVQRESGKWLISDCEGLQGLSADDSPAPSRGQSSSATPAGTPQPGAARSKPVVLGQSAVVEKQWQITVRKVNKDAWPVIKAYSSSADPPAINERFVLVEVAVKNTGSGDKVGHLGDFNFRLTGSRNELYDAYQKSHDCGLVPDEIGADLFPGGETKGNVCFRIPADETGLLLVWKPFTGDPTYFDLQ